MNTENPLPNTYWVIAGRLLAGEHPSSSDSAESRDRVGRLARAGINYFIDLTEPGERPEYRHLLPKNSRYVRSPIADTAVPYNVSQTQTILQTIKKALQENWRVYVHCRAGIGRTGLIVGCFLANGNSDGKSALHELNRLWLQSARAETWPKVPQTAEQADYIRRWPLLRGAAVPGA